MNDTKKNGEQRAIRRPFYPANVRPTNAELRDHKIRSKKFKDVHLEIIRKFQRYDSAQDYMAFTEHNQKNWWIAGGVAALLLLYAFLSRNPVHQAVMFGLFAESGELLRKGTWGWILFFVAEGSLGLYVVLSLIHRQKKNLCHLDIERHEDWIKHPKIRQDDLMEALIPVYEEDCPFDPTDPDFKVVAGEHYDRCEAGTYGAYKYGSRAFWYTLNIRGSQAGGTIIYGITGSGKTSACLRPILRQVFSYKADVSYDPDGRGREKMAGLVLDPKGNLSYEAVLPVLKSAGMDPIRDPMVIAKPGKDVFLTPLLFDRCVEEKEYARRAVLQPLFDKVKEIREEMRGIVGPDTKRKLEKDEKRLLNDLRQNLRKVEGEYEALAKKYPSTLHEKRFREYKKACLIGAYNGGSVQHLWSREGDYIELGFDAERIHRIWDCFGAIQQAAKELKSPTDAVNAGDPYLEEKRLKKEKTQDGSNKDSKAEDFGQLSFKKPSGCGNLMAGWRPASPRVESEEAIRGAYRELFRCLEQFVGLAFIGSHERSSTLYGEGATLAWSNNLSFNMGFPGTSDPKIRDLDAYANIRQEIRRLAPTKERPGESLTSYRGRWFYREANLRIYNRNVVLLARQVMDASRSLIVVGAGDPVTVGFARELVESIQLFIQPLNEILGPESVGQDTPRPRRLKPSENLQAMLKRVMPQLSPSLRERFSRGEMTPLSVPTGDDPRPLPVNEEVRRKRGNRFASPDPLVHAVLESTGLRRVESELARKITAATRKHLAAGGITEEIQRRHGLEISRALVGAGGPPSAADEVGNRVLAGLIEDAGDSVLTLIGRDAAGEVARTPGLEGLKWFDSKVWQHYAESEMKALALGFADAELPDAQGLDWERVLGGVLGRHFAVGEETSVLRRLMRRYLDAGIFRELFIGVAGPEGIEEILGKYRRVIERTLMEFHGYLVKDIVPKVAEEMKGEASLVGKLWADGQVVMKEIADCYNLRVMDGLADLGAKLSVHGKVYSFRSLDRALLFRPRVELGNGFWQGKGEGDDLVPLSVIQWDEAWAECFWKRMAYIYLSSPKGDPSWARLSGMTSALERYHVSAVRSYLYYVAPNAGHRTDGPFAFNPLYLPEMNPINIAHAFSKTVFEAQAKAGSSSDPYWENSAFTLIYQCLKVLYLTEGYATFPKIRQLITEDAILRAKVEALQQRKKNRDAGPQEMDDIEKVAQWYWGEWKNPGAEKGETKANVVSTLSVVTQPFLESDYLIFSPQCEEDISFPGWSWVFKHGKVVASSLSVAFHEKVAQVVLPLLNKSFQDAVMARETKGLDAKKLLATGRKQIEELRHQREGLCADLRKKVATFRVLEELLGDGRGEATGIRLVKLLCEPAQAGIPVGTPVSDVVLRLMGTSGVTTDQLVAMTLAWKGEARVMPFGKAWSRATPAVRGALNAGWLLREVFELEELPGWARLPMTRASEGPAGAPARAEAFLKGIKGHLGRVGRLREDVLQQIENLGVGSDVLDRLVALLGELPLGLLMAREELLSGPVRNRLKLHHDAISAEVSEGVGTQQHMSIHGQVARLTAAIREIEDKIEDVPNTTRPVVWMVDEAHFFVTGEADAKYLSVARSANALNFLSTQSPSAIYAKMEEQTAKQFMDNLPNRLILRAPDAKSATECADMLGGKVRQLTYETNVTQSFKDLRANRLSGGGVGQAEGGSVSVNKKWEERYIVEPTEIVNLMSMEAFAFTWDGKRATQQRRIFMKPDYLYASPEARYYIREKAEYFKDLPASYKDGEDLYAYPVLRLLQLGILDTSKR